MSFTELVWTACSKIPKGKVSTYGRIARAIGKPGASRAVGNALNRNRSSRIPCHRVVRSDGSVGGFAHGTKAKVRMLEKEGVVIRNGKVQNLSKMTKKL
jgi:O-6-methylguanine DNA methyltransferase